MTESSSAAGFGGEQLARELAVKQIERKRHFHMHLFTYLAGSILIATIWAVTEYNNAGGWPSHGFSQSSGQPGVWNLWIIYPILGWGLFVAIQGWFTYMRKPITESEIQREIKRLTDSSD